MNYYIGIDNGGTFVKTSLFDDLGNEVKVVSEPVSTINKENGVVERDMDELWESNLLCLKKLLTSVDIDLKTIKGIGLSGHGKGLYLLDKNKKELKNAILSSDERAKSLLTEIRKNESYQKIYNLTGQEAMPGQPSLLLSWLKINDKSIYEKIGYVLSVNDYIRFKLTGEIKSESSIISGSGLYNIFSKEIDTEILKIYGIEEMTDKFPKTINSCESGGILQQDIKEELNIFSDVLVTGGMFDVDACALALGVVEENELFTITGTWTINGYLSNEPILENKVGLNSSYIIPDTYLIEESSPAGAANMDSYLETFINVEGLSKDELYAQCSEALKEEGIQKDLLVYPFLYGSNSVHSLRGTVMGLSNSMTRNDLIKAICEGPCFVAKMHMERLQATLPVREYIKLGGGVAKNEAWIELYASILNKEIHVVQGIDEMGCFGAALSAKAAYEDLPIKELVHNLDIGKVKKYYPKAADVQLYEKKYQKFVKTYTALEDIY